MAYTEDLARVQIIFRLDDDAGPREQAVTGFHMHARITTGQTTHWADWVQAAAEGIRDRWVEHIGKGLFASSVVAQAVKVFHLTPAGLTLDEGMATFDGEALWVGTMPDSLPWEDTVVLSTYSYPIGAFVPFRASRRGRMFLPPAGKGAIGGKEGRITDTYVLALKDAFVAFFNDVQGMHLDNEEGPTDLHWDLVIASKAKTMSNRFERFDIGNVVDVQTRRRKDEVESRTNGEWTAADD